MQTKILAGMLGTAAAAAALTALVLLPKGPAEVETAAVAAAQAQSASDAPGAMKQGIAVKGHWTIEVRNPDGTVADRREFDNALQPYGQRTLARLLSAQTKVRTWNVSLHGSPQPCLSQSGTAAACNISQSDGSSQETSLSSFNLQVTPTETGVTLRGSKTVSQTGSIGTVGTTITECPPDVPAGQPCGALPEPSLGMFTVHYLPANANISVVEGQTVMAEVQISFAAAP